MAAALAYLAFAALTLLVLIVAGRPLATDDLWWHLKLGELYAAQGPWLEADPLLETPLGPPAPASWLADVALHDVLEAVGFQGLRVAHVALVLAIALLVARLCWRESRGNAAAAALASGVFLCVSWYRLVQLRPELVTILLSLSLYALLLARDEPPSRRRVAAACGLMLLGANAHAGFMLGPLLLGVGLLGLLLGAALERRLGLAAAASLSLARARRVGAALGLGLGVALLNPRGVHQLLAPFAALFEPRLPFVRDEWSSFDPLRLPAPAVRMDLLAWLLADALILALCVAGLIGIWRLVRRPSADALRRADPVLLLLALLSIGAMLLAIRLHWLAVFPALLLLRMAPAPGELGPAARRLAGWGCALALCALLIAAPRLGGLRPTRLGVPQGIAAYLETPYIAPKYHARAVWFLRDAGLSGHLFSHYYLGGFHGFWLAPGIRSFVNGTLNFPPERLLQDYDAVLRARPAASGEGFLEILAERDVDLVVGVGLPLVRDPRLPPRYSTALLEDAPDWIPAFRSLDSAVYLRRPPAGSKNLERVAAYYESQGIPFDSERGFDAGRVLHERPDWALAHGLVPESHAELLVQSRSPDPRLRLPALERLGSLYAALGLYEEGLAVEEQILAHARSSLARRRLIWNLLRLGTKEEAIARAEALRAFGPRDPLLELYLRVARGDGGPPVALLPLLTRPEASRLLAGVRPDPVRYHASQWRTSSTGFRFTGPKG